MKLDLTVDSISIIRWWLDISHNAYDDFMGHTGAMVSLGRGTVTILWSKHKINVRSLTEGKLVGTNDTMGTIIWGKYFIEYQGYMVEHNILYQDNKSTILL